MKFFSEFSMLQDALMVTHFLVSFQFFLVERDRMWIQADRAILNTEKCIQNFSKRTRRKVSTLEIGGRNKNET